jgi:hypothetical protein
MTAELHGPRISEQGHHTPQERYYDAVGRPRKLAQGAMFAIQREFKKGIPTKELADRYGISVSLVLQICYFTPKGAPKTRPKPADKRPVVIPFERTANMASSDTDGTS